MNTLLKVSLCNIHPFGQRKIAETAVTCDATEVKNLIHKYFDCFNMPEPSPWHNQFYVEVSTAPLWAFDDPEILQNAENLNEDNPFLLNDDDNNWVWHNVNEYLYSGGVR